MKTRTLVTAALAGLVLAVAGGGIALSASTGHAKAAQAREVTRKFFQTINSRSYARTCELMSTRFYRQNHIPDKQHCVLGLTVGFAMSPSVRFRILRVQRHGDRAVVTALANGIPGRIVLINERGGLRVLSVGS
jgi:hypothetical protein